MTQAENAQLHAAQSLDVHSLNDHRDALELRGCRRTHLHGAGNFTIPGAEAHYPPDLGLEPRHLEIRLHVDVNARSATAEILSRVVANRAGAAQLTLHGVDFQEVEASDLTGAALHSSYDGNEIHLSWQEGWAAGEERQVSVRYRVEDPVSGLHFGGPDEHHPDLARWAATDHETERARYWLACVDLPSVRTTLDIKLRADSAFTILANGLLQGTEDHGDGTKTAHWHLDYPCPSYLICFALGELVEAVDKSVQVGDQTLDLRYYCARGRGTADDLLRSFGRTPEIMEWLQARVGNPFPFRKYYQFGLPGFGGAMENISLVSWDDMYVLDETFAREIGEMVESVNVHEMAHSYFGDAVVIRDFAHAWLKESWATYLETCWFEDKYGKDAQGYDLFKNARAYFDEADNAYKRPIVTRVFDHSWSMYDRHLYPGGAWRMHMLRGLLGDDVFWGAVADYVATFSKQTVETDDFRKVLERHSGRSLGRFFDQWVHGRGYPKLKASWSYDAKAAEGTLTLEQTQVPEGKEGDKAGDTLFDLELEVAWEDAEGAWHRKTITMDGRKATRIFALAAAPRQIRIDPDLKVLHRLEFNPGDEMLKHAVRHAPDITGRILAAEELLKTGKRSAFETVRDAFRDEPFHGVRAAMAQAAGDTKSAAAIGLLVDMLEHEEDVRVQHAIALQLGKFKDDRIGPAVVKLLDGSPTYRVAAAALTALGRQRGTEHLARLREASHDAGHRSIVRGGALAGLASTRTEEAFGEILDRVGYGKEPADVRPRIPGALAAATQTLHPRFRDQAIEALTQLLRDPTERVRIAAVRALGQLAATSALGDIEGAIPTFPVQEAPVVRRVLAGIRKSGGVSGKAAGLQKEVEELRELTRKLEERLAKLEAENEKE